MHGVAQIRKKLHPKKHSIASALIGQEKQDRSEKTYDLYREKFNRHIFLLRQVSLMNVLLNDLICQLIQFF